MLATLTGAAAATLPGVLSLLVAGVGALLGAAILLVLGALRARARARRWERDYPAVELPGEPLRGTAGPLIKARVARRRALAAHPSPVGRARIERARAATVAARVEAILARAA